MLLCAEMIHVSYHLILLPESLKVNPPAGFVPPVPLDKFTLTF